MPCCRSRRWRRVARWSVRRSSPRPSGWSCAITCHALGLPRNHRCWGSMLRAALRRAGLRYLMRCCTHTNTHTHTHTRARTFACSDGASAQGPHKGWVWGAWQGGVTRPILGDAPRNFFGLHPPPQPPLLKSEILAQLAIPFGAWWPRFRNEGHPPMPPRPLSTGASKP